MVSQQGKIYWMDLEGPGGSGPQYRHPVVVIQNNVFNQSRLRTVVVCSLTSNLKRTEAPGDVLLEKGEANLPRQSVVNVPQIFTVNNSQLGGYIGALSPRRVWQILQGFCWC